MKTKLSLFAAFLLVLGALQGNLVFAAEEQKAPPPDCCFEHPDYQGTCAVTPAEGETCASILDYLNSPGTANKTYCGSTRIRGGWSEVECKKPEQTQQKAGRTEVLASHTNP